MRTLCSTGSVLAPEGFDYVYRSIKPDVCLSSISGGTGHPVPALCPVVRSCRSGAGKASAGGCGDGGGLFNDEGQPVRGEGERWAKYYQHLPESARLFLERSTG
ncbi:MAG: hypothetical protein R3E95_00285 [Thiolinea sp.]